MLIYHKQRDVIVMQGDVLVDIPLETILDTHNIQGSAATVILKEIDFSQKAKVQVQRGEVQNYDIFGLTKWEGSSDESSQRLVFKTNNIENENMPLYVKGSLMKKY